MTAVPKILVFAVVLAAVFALSLWAGHTFGPSPESAAPATTSQHSPPHGGG
ncbi:hypothetical protein Mycch_3848 [Mycolicibacterium chubuense NBB4]|uniref:Uncharacterized protein n=1 Tax=Mycolicibacterium chubuense (strain NBB4) TaxID=710421 RepID=I4BMR7_MYCCN|nr:hypothetical protein [Mycolicibacterium chubuense]AFM18574.1 hypothetical protein Mycch_3848 [Mycolicibacterium chubuense NBB4]